MTAAPPGGIAARVFGALALSIVQLGDPRILKVLAKSLALTLLICLLPGAGVWLALPRLAGGWIGQGAGALLGTIAAIVWLWLLFRVTAIAVIGLFADEVVAAVEARHYPAARARATPFVTALAMGVRSALRALVVNLLLLPVYVLLLATGIGTAVALLAVNGWLLGRDLGDMVAVRHLPPAEMPGWRRATAGRRFLLGVGNAAVFVVPVVNLLAPVLGAAMATHLFHRSRE